jgi:hypothetical protein
VDYYIGLAVGVLGCLTVEIGHAVYKSVKRSREKKRLALDSSHTLAVELSKAVTLPNLSRLVKGKDKIVWCDNEYWFYDWLNNMVVLALTKPEIGFGKPEAILHIKEMDIERLLEAKEIEARTMPKFLNSAELVNDYCARKGKNLSDALRLKRKLTGKPTTGKGKK